MMEEIISLNTGSFKIWYESLQERMDIINSLQSNLIFNSGFEDEDDLGRPLYWAERVNAGDVSFPYATGKDGIGKGAAISSFGYTNAYWLQPVSGIIPGASYKLTAYAKLTNVSGLKGAYIQIDWFSSTAFLQASWSPPLKGTTPWTQMTVDGMAPSNAITANIALILNGSGTVVYDDVSLTIPPPPPTYSCINNACTQNLIPCQLGTDNCYTESTCGGHHCIGDIIIPPDDIELITYSCRNSVCTRNSTPCQGTQNCYSESTCGGTSCIPLPRTYSCVNQRHGRACRRTHCQPGTQNCYTESTCGGGCGGDDGSYADWLLRGRLRDFKAWQEWNNNRIHLPFDTNPPDPPPYFYF